MGVIQEKRHDASMPKVDERDYGVKVITASVESPAVVEEQPVVNDEAESVAAVDPDVVQAVAHDDAEASAVQEVSEKKKAGRPRKSDKKK